MSGDPQFLHSLASNPAGWRSEEDYLLARLGVSIGVLDPQAVQDGLRIQGQALQNGQPLSLSQVLLREQRLTPEALLQIKAELARSLRTCPGCGQARYLAGGREPRSEPCPRCGSAIPVPPASQSLSATAVARREQALRASGAGTARWRGRDPLASPDGGPRLFGQYVLEAQLARGGMGAVYRARHQQSGQVYALKVLLAGEKASEAQVHRFQRELKAQTELDHPNVVRVHHSGEWEGVLYCAMDLVEGQDLNKALPGLGLRERIGILAKVCRAIQHAHAHGYIHRDLKPGNVLVGADLEPKVTDFGLAKNLGGETRLTREGSVLGTPYYMAPEQAAGHVEQMGPRTDVWALGVLLYEAITDQLPFNANTAIELYRKICEERPLPLADFGQNDARLQTIVSRALEKRPEDRYPSAEMLADDLERWLRGDAPQMSQISSAVRLARKMGQHRRSLAVLGGAIGLGLVAIAVVVVLTARFIEQGRLDKARLALVAAGGELDRLAVAREPEGLDQALAAAEGLLEAGAADARELERELSGLSARRAAALLVRAELGLERRDRTGAARAIACARAIQESGAAAPAEKLEAMGLELLALRRRGEREQLAARLEAVRAAAKGDAGQLEPGEDRLRQLALIEAELALPASPEEALRHLGPDQPGPSSTQALLLRARALAGTGNIDEARRAFERARGQGGRRALLVEADAWRTIGQPELAAAALEEARQLPGADDHELLRLLALVRLGCGRPDLVVRTFSQVAKLDPELEGLLQRAREQLGLPDARKELERLAPSSGEARLRLAELASVTSAFDAAVAARGSDPRPLAARARSRAGGDDPKGAKEDLELLAAELDEAPADVGAGPILGRALRDAAWARQHLREEGEAARLIGLAVRALPEDLDAAFLAAHAKVSHPAGGVREVLRRELSSLEGPLSRGLFLGRLARIRGSRELAELAVPLLEARVAGEETSLVELELELRRLEGVLGQPPLEVAPTGPPWSELMAPVGPPPVPPEPERAKVEAEVGQLRLVHKNEDGRVLEELEALRARHPAHPPLLWELANRSVRHHVGSFAAFRPWIDWVGRCPSWAFPLVLRVRIDLRGASVLAESPREALDRLLKDEPSSTTVRGLALVERYLGALFPEDKDPAWRGATPEELRQQIDQLVLEEPAWVWLLYLRAHLGEVLGPGQRASVDRDLVVLRAATRGEVDQDGRPCGELHRLYAAWILAPIRTDEAAAELQQVPAIIPFGSKELRQMWSWTERDSRLDALKATPGWQAFKERSRSY